VQGLYRPLGFLRKDPVTRKDGDIAYGMNFEVGEIPLAPGETRRMTCFFTYQGSFDTFLEAKKFYVWDGRVTGEATLIGQKN
jgi:hypothetical protein